jgi:hypothetical protein
MPLKRDIKNNKSLKAIKKGYKAIIKIIGE